MIATMNDRDSDSGRNEAGNSDCFRNVEREGNLDYIEYISS